MAFPVVPILIAGVALMALAGKKKSNGKTGTDVGDGPEVVLVDGLEEFEELIKLKPGDELQVALDETAPYVWQLYTEAVEGSPVVVVEQQVQPPEGGAPMPGEPVTRLFRIYAEESAGKIQADFLLAHASDPNNVQEQASMVIEIV